MFTAELSTFINLFENLQSEYKKAQARLQHRINELSTPQDFYEDSARLAERADLIHDLENNEREQTQIRTIISILTKTTELATHPDFVGLNNDEDFRILREKLSSETFNPTYTRQVDIDQKAAAIFDASNALDNLQIKLNKQPLEKA